MCVLGAFLLAPATKLQQNWIERREENGPISVEDEMRSLVSSAMEGVGYKQPEARKRRSSNSDAGSDAGPSASASAGADAGTGAGASASSGVDTGAHTTGGDVQQFGNMQVIT